MKKVVTLEIETEETNENLGDRFAWGAGWSRGMAVEVIQVQVMQIQEEGDA